MLLPLLGPVLLLPGCLGLGRTAPVIPNRERPHQLSQDVQASVWIAQGVDATGKTQFVEQPCTIPAGFVVFAPELIYPASSTSSAVTP